VSTTLVVSSSRRAWEPPGLLTGHRAYRQDPRRHLPVDVNTGTQGPVRAWLAGALRDLAGAGPEAFAGVEPGGCGTRVGAELGATFGR